MIKSMIGGLSLETTGLSVAEGHKIIELCLRRYDSVTGVLIDSYTQRFDPQRAIDAAAEAVHKISYSDLVGQPIFADKADEIRQLMNACDLIVIHNAEFDAPFVAVELAGAGVELRDSLEFFCTMESGRWSTDEGKLPRLGELCWALGVSYDKDSAHAAEYDVQKMMECFFKGRDRGFFEQPGE